VRSPTTSLIPVVVLHFLAVGCESGETSARANGEVDNRGKSSDVEIGKEELNFRSDLQVKAYEYCASDRSPSIRNQLAEAFLKSCGKPYPTNDSNVCDLLKIGGRISCDYSRLP
jgi:hypothetical protein